MSRSSDWEETGIDASVNWIGDAVPCDTLKTGRCIAVVSGSAGPLAGDLSVAVSNRKPSDYLHRQDMELTIPEDIVDIASVAVSGDGTYGVEFDLDANYVLARFLPSAGSGTLAVRLHLKGDD